MIRNQNIIDIINQIILEQSENIEIKPNISRNSGFTKGLVYLSIDKSYAEAYANNQTSAAHAFKGIIRDGVLFHICLDENVHHYGGDVWISGFKDDIVNDLKNLKSDINYELNSLTIDFLNRCGINDFKNFNIDYFLKYLTVNNLSIISADDWSNLQEQYQGYSEICVKEVKFDEIIKIEIFKEFDIVKTINGGCNKDYNTIYYHGSPLKYWEHLL